MSKLNLSLLCLWWNSPFFILANIVFYAFIFSLPHPVVGFASLPAGLENPEEALDFFTGWVEGGANGPK